MPRVAINGDRQVSESDIPGLLATIRHFESNNNYTAKSGSSSASGAYQIINSSWHNWASFVPGASNYATAKDAPPAVQDAVAGAAVSRILASHGNWLSSVPINWYLPTAWENPTVANQVPPGGNTMTVAAYAQRWVNYFTGGKADPSTAGGGAQPPNGVKIPGDSGNTAITKSSTKPPSDPTGGNPLTVDGGQYVYQSTTNLPVYTTGSDAYTVVNGFRIMWPVHDMGLGDIVNGVLGVVKKPFEAIGSVVDFLKLLARAETWIRVVKIIGGVMAVIMGLVILGKEAMPNVPLPI